MIVRPFLALGLVAASLAACAAPTSGPSTSADGVSGRVTVLAAASLTESLDAIATDFEASHPGLEVEVSYGSSATLVQQANQGAPADVLALAGESAAKPLDASLVRDQRIFATNVLEIAVPPDNPAGITGINDLGRAGLKVVLCAPTVPCGMAADATFKKARIVPSVVSREIDVKATLAKARLGEADAAVVYHSDVVASKDAVVGIEIPPPFNTALRYPVLRLGSGDAAQAFVEFLMSEQSRATLTSYGFGAP